MKKLLFTMITAVVAFAAYAQEAYPCHTDQQTKEFIEQLSPAERAQYEAEQQAYEQEIQQYISNHPEIQTNNGSRSVQYTIPVVFHIIHAGGPENISDEQVEDCIRIMNEDYQKLNADANQVQSEFASIVADSEIEFKLAKKDPQGNCTNGITRTFSNVTFGGDGNDRISAVQGEHGNWPGDEYMNVFVAENIGGAAGYTYTPNNWIGADMGNGIHVLQNYVGSIGTSSPGTSRTMTHEAGHWLNLSHLWGGSNSPGLSSNCNDDDGVNDTPNTIGWESCNLQGTTCDAQKDNVENFLEYSYCSKMFTLDQKSRMHAALNSSTGGRNNIHSASNLNATGVNEPDVMCKADFEASQRVICSGQTVNFTDYSFHGPSGWTWNFEGGTPSTSNAQDPSVVYNTPGTYEVELTATDGSNSATETKTSYITVLPDGSSMPYGEDFEAYNDLANSRWSVNNPGGNEAFQLDEQIGHTGTQSVRLNNFGQPAEGIDEIISNPVDLTSISTEVTLSFRYAYRKRSSANEEWLRVFITSDCGDSWAQRKTIKGNSLGSDIATSAWEPESQDDWVTVHMTNITSSFWVDNFRVKFQFEADNGNNFFLDNINIYPGSSDDEALSIDEQGAFNGFKVFPNPAQDEANVEFAVTDSKNTRVTVMNTIGQEVISTDVQAQPGKNRVVLSTRNLESGVYFVKVGSEGAQQTERLIVK
ncbi:MAG: zinc-dependent metalloprotease [Bacteroidota bacterium]